MLYQFRKELIQKLLKEHEVVLVMPFVGHVEDFKQMGCRCISMDVDRRGTNPMTDLKLYKAYSAILKKEHPDLVITYSYKAKYIWRNGSSEIEDSLLCECTRIRDSL